MLFLLACVGGESVTTPQWYLTCGDPVCSGYSGPFDGVDRCTTETAGDGCKVEGSTCDPQNDCNALLTCTTEDPTAQTGGCPISRKVHKTEIAYLDPAARDAAAQAALDMKLTTWRYRWEPVGTQPHLGFLIDDAPTSPAVRADGEHVDLYGYTSLTLAAVQSQAAQLAAQRALIDAQAAQLAAQEARIAALEARLSAP